MAEVSTKELRANKLKGLRNNAGQDSSWKMGMVEVVDELARENHLLKQGFLALKREIESLKQEKVEA